MSYYTIIIEFANTDVQDERILTIRFGCSGYDEALRFASEEVEKLYADKVYEVFDVKVEFDFEV